MTDTPNTALAEAAVAAAEVFADTLDHVDAPLSGKPLYVRAAVIAAYLQGIKVALDTRAAHAAPVVPREASEAMVGAGCRKPVMSLLHDDEGDLFVRKDDVTDIWRAMYEAALSGSAEDAGEDACVRDCAAHLQGALNRQACSTWGLGGDECDLEEAVLRFLDPQNAARLSPDKADLSEQAREDVAFALGGADELERQARIAQSVADDAPAISDSDTMRATAETYAAHARFLQQQATAIRALAALKSPARWNEAIEAAAKVADSFHGRAKRERIAKGWKMSRFQPHERDEIAAEENGENIASAEIAKAIRALARNGAGADDEAGREG